MASDGIQALYIETRNYGATAAFWRSLGYVNVFETDHGSGQWEHPSGGPYLFIDEKQKGDLVMRPVLGVADCTTFAPTRAVEFVEPFEAQHWHMMAATILDPDGRTVGLHAPLPEGVVAPDADAHHEAKYGSS